MAATSEARDAARTLGTCAGVGRPPRSRPDAQRWKPRRRCLLRSQRIGNLSGTRPGSPRPRPNRAKRRLRAVRRDHAWAATAPHLAVLPPPSLRSRPPHQRCSLPRASPLPQPVLVPSAFSLEGGRCHRLPHPWSPSGTHHEELPTAISRMAARRQPGRRRHPWTAVLLGSSAGEDGGSRWHRSTRPGRRGGRHGRLACPVCVPPSNQSSARTALGTLCAPGARPKLRRARVTRAKYY